MNNNMLPSASGKCYCGRYMTIGEEKGGVSPIGYRCPTCTHEINSKRYAELMAKKSQLN